MTINYYEIRNCSLLYFMGYPIFLAPDGTDEELLAKRGFAKQNDGKWIRYADQFEYSFIMEFRNNDEIDLNEETIKNFSYTPMNYPPQMYYAAPPQDNTTANILCIISITLMAAAVPVLLTSLAFLSGLLFIAAMVLMIIARVMFPQSTFAKVLCIVYICLAVLALVIGIISVILLMIACNECVNSLRSCS